MTKTVLEIERGERGRGRGRGRGERGERGGEGGEDRESNKVQFIGFNIQVQFFF